MYPFLLCSVYAVRPGESHFLARLSQPYFDHARKRLLDRDVEPALAVPAAKRVANELLSRGSGSGAGTTTEGSSAAAAAASSSSSSSLAGAVTASGTGTTADVLLEHRLETELPWYSKYLLLAAFAASHNPPETDTQYFSRMSSGKRRKKSKRGGGGGGAGRSGVREALLEGPRQFTRERLLAIFCALVAGNEGTDLARELSHTSLQYSLLQLESLQLVLRVSHPRDVAAVRYVCKLAAGTATLLAHNIKLDLGKYLHDAVAMQ